MLCCYFFIAVARLSYLLNFLFFVCLLVRSHPAIYLFSVCPQLSWRLNGRATLLSWLVSYFVIYRSVYVNTCVGRMESKTTQNRVNKCVVVDTETYSPSFVLIIRSPSSVCIVGHTPTLIYMLMVTCVSPICFVFQLEWFLWWLLHTEH